MTSVPFDPDLSGCRGVNDVDRKPFDDGRVDPGQQREDSLLQP